MGQRTRYQPGTFSWVDLATTDAAGAKAFYGGLFGWEAEDMPVGEGMVYSMLRLDGDYVAALYEMDSEQRGQGMPPNWASYVSVADADATAARARELGGVVMAEAFDVFESGRMATIQDPGGAVVSVWQPRNHIGATRVNDPGSLTWNELRTGDPEAATAFYTSLFGWEAEAIEQDGATVYVTIKNGGRLNGGILPVTEQMTRAFGEMPPHWLPYFTVLSTDGAVATARELGGKLLAGPMDLPTGRNAVIGDPQGAAFAVFEGETDD